MSKKILIVEDESIIAEDIKRSLLNYCYIITDIISNGSQAISSIAKNQPDLILMDIKIEGRLDGIATAEEINKHFDIPIVYLTANADEATLNRAKATNPYGYLVKPFEEIDLNATIQIAFSKHESDKALRESENRFKKMIEENTDGIIVVDDKGSICFVNNAATRLFGKDRINLIGTRLDYPLQSDELQTIVIASEPGKEKIGEMHIVETEWERKPAYLATIRDITLRKNAEKALRQSNLKLRKLMEEVVNGLVFAIEMRDPYTAGHQRRVAELACKIGEEMKLSVDQLDGLRIAALLHDIGKIHVPSEILSKPGKLTKVEFAIIESHAEAGYDILKTIEFPWPIAQIVLQHHEKMDGSSYPNGLKTDDILLEARIICVADVIEAMSSHRPYRPALGLKLALQEINMNKGILYDDNVVIACNKVMKTGNFQFN
ncbi:MAG: HD domain-containing protein [Candidatus Cloacimonadales bacterium]|nr:HD domain-containing protein [Candidatus Cloacimonadales bacterium]